MSKNKLSSMSDEDLEGILSGDGFDVTSPDCGDISKVQVSLKQLGYYHGPINGLRDEAMLDPIQNFLRDQGLPENNKSNTAFCSALQSSQKNLRSMADEELAKRRKGPSPDDSEEEDATPPKSNSSAWMWGGALLLGTVALFFVTSESKRRGNPLREDVLVLADQIHRAEDRGRSHDSMVLVRDFLKNNRDPQDFEDLLFALSIPRISSRTILFLLKKRKDLGWNLKSRAKFFDEARRRLYDEMGSTVKADAILREVR